MRRHIAAVALCAGLAACTTAYGPATITGGYSDREISPDTWVVVFAGNGYTTRETVQTFWLYRAANLTLEQGYDAFAIATPMNLVAWHGRRVDDPALTPIAYIEDPNKPVLVGTIRMFKKPVAIRPPKMFDAAALKAVLEPHVRQLCTGNVCPHFHGYLLPPLASAFRPQMPAQYDARDL